jgi:hypothetical protein
MTPRRSFGAMGSILNSRADDYLFYFAFKSKGFPLIFFEEDILILSLASVVHNGRRSGNAH